MVDRYILDPSASCIRYDRAEWDSLTPGSFALDEGASDHSAIFTKRDWRMSSNTDAPVPGCGVDRK